MSLMLCQPWRSKDVVSNRHAIPVFPLLFFRDDQSNIK